MAAIEARHLRKQFGTVIAVDDVNLAVREGEIFGFLGPNGAGKTTTIRLLTAVLTPDTGHALIQGINIHRHPLEAKMQMGVIPENSTVYGDLSALQNLRLVGKLYGLPHAIREERMQEVLGRLGLWERRSDPVRTFSKGMRQRISIAVAILHHPPVLFLDEPTAGLDVQSRRLVIDTIHHMNEEGSAVFLTTHNIEEADALCERISIINRGKIIATGSPEELRKTFDTTQSVEVSFDRKVGRELFATDAITKAEPVGDKWRLYTGNPDRVVKFIGAVAERDHLTITSISTPGPSLEEAFVRLTEGAG